MKQPQPCLLQQLLAQPTQVEGIPRVSLASSLSSILEHCILVALQMQTMVPPGVLSLTIMTEIVCGETVKVRILSFHCNQILL